MRLEQGQDPDESLPWRCYTRDERMQVLEVFALASDREWRIVWPLRPAPCPACGGSAHVDIQWDGCVVHCGDCYDPSPVHSESGFRDLIGQGDTEAKAIADWNQRVEELAS
jgi:hypothetical protein